MEFLKLRHYLILPCKMSTYNNVMKLAKEGSEELHLDGLFPLLRIQITLFITYYFPSCVFLAHLFPEKKYELQT